MRGASAPIQGDCDPAFARLREAFAENFASGGEIGAALAVRAGGRRVVDLWGGHCDRERTVPWERDTLVNAFSVGKAVVAMLALGQVEAGRLDLDDPVARHWPEFAAAGKDRVTIRELLCHRAGLPGVRRALGPRDPYDWETMTRALAEQAPFWWPHEGHGYHVNTFGYLVGELIRRATGERVGAVLRSALSLPLGADFHFGLPRALHRRVAPLHLGSAEGAATAERIDGALPRTGDAERDQMIRCAYANPPQLSGIGSVNTAAWRSAEIPSTNGHGTARAVASLYAAFLAGGTRSLPIGAALRAEATRPHSEGRDLVLDRETRFGLGFQLGHEARPMGPGPRAFGHYGYGGALGFADPDADLAFGYLMNRPGDRWRTPRTRRLLGALAECLGACPPPPAG